MDRASQTPLPSMPELWMAWSCVDLVQTVTAAVSQFMSTVVLPTPDASIGQSPPHSLTHRFSPALLPLCSLSLDGWGMVVEMQMFSLGLSTQYSLLSSCYIFLVHPSILCFRVSQLHSLRGQYLIMSCFGEIFWAHEQFFYRCFISTLFKFSFCNANYPISLFMLSLLKLGIDVNFKKIHLSFQYMYMCLCVVMCPFEEYSLGVFCGPSTFLSFRNSTVNQYHNPSFHRASPLAGRRGQGVRT